MDPVKESRNQVSRHLLEPDRGGRRATNLLDLDRSWGSWEGGGILHSSGWEECLAELATGTEEERWFQQNQTFGDAPLEAVFTPSPGIGGPAV